MILNHFCNTDTICAIAGRLCGAYYEFNKSYNDILNEKLDEELLKYIK